MKPYYKDEAVTLYHGDCRDLLPQINPGGVSMALADPPYAETSLDWDRWPDGWAKLAAEYASSMWCFGSMRMFLDRRDEFDGWNLSQDIVWEKHNGSGFHADRFKRVHEVATHWYRGDWESVYKDVPVTMDATKRAVRRKERPPHTGEIAGSTYISEDGGPRLMRSVIYCRSMHGRAINETEKPGGILEPLIQYGCPPGGLLLDLFSGSSSALMAAKATGRRGIGFEVRESQCEQAAERLAQDILPFGEAS